MLGAVGRSLRSWHVPIWPAPPVATNMAVGTMAVAQLLASLHDLHVMVMALLSLKIFEVDINISVGLFWHKLG